MRLETDSGKFSSQGFRVVIPDQVGFGKSSKPKDLQYTFHFAMNLNMLKPLPF